MMKLILENWRRYLNEASGLETTWDDVHIDDVFEIVGNTCENGRKCITFKPSDLESKLANKPSVTLDPERVENAELEHPLIVVVDRDTEEYQYIMDGNHRYAKAKQLDVEVQVKELYTDEYENLFRSATIKAIHKLADDKGIPWDDDADFMDWTEEEVGESHLDDMTSEELDKVYKALEERGKEDK